MEISVDVLADMVRNSTFRPRDISREKQVVLEEILSVKDTPEEYIFDLFQEKVFPDNSLGYPILGYPQTVEKFKRKSVIDFWNDNYRPSNLIIAAAGRIDHKSLVKCVNQKFEKDFTPPGNYFQVKPDAAKNVRFVFNESLNQSHICLGGEGLSFCDKARFDFIALNVYLGGGMSSKLFQLLREKYGYVYAVYSFIDFYKDVGIWGVYAGTDKKNEQKAIDIIKEEFMRLYKRPITPERVDELKEQIKGNLLLSLESSFKRMTRIAKNEMYFQDYISIDDLVKKIETITPSSLFETAQKYMNPDQFNTITISPLNAA